MNVETLVKEFYQLSQTDKERFFVMLGDLEDISPEWKAEIKDRWQAYKNGEVTLLDGHRVEQMLAHKHGVSL